MGKRSQFQVLTGYDLTTGAVVYWGEDGWVTDFAQARVLSAQDEAGSLTIAAREEAAQRVTGGYLIFVEGAADGTVQAIAMRERARIAGPSIAYLPNDTAARR